jgi:predicted pyridoxine 5'-phosphate oxidase superfamily flavin-nucleotide-binding protein
MTVQRPKEDRQSEMFLRTQEFIAHQEMLFIATANSAGACDCSFRAGSPRFVHVLDEKSLAFPESRGNGVLASGGNIVENPHVGMIFLDFEQTTVRLHVNGLAQVPHPGRGTQRAVPSERHDRSGKDQGRATARSLDRRHCQQSVYPLLQTHSSSRTLGEADRVRQRR